MTGINRYKTIQRLTDPIDPERLRAHSITWDCINDHIVGNVGKMRGIDGDFRRKLINPVPLLRHDAFDQIEPPDSIIRKTLCICRKKDRFQSFHHLGIMSIWIMVAMALTPGRSSGNVPDTYAFLFVVPLYASIVSQSMSV